VHTRVFHRRPSAADARQVSVWLEGAFAQLTAEFGSDAAEIAASIPVLDVYLHTQPSDLAGPGRATLVTRRDQDGKHATLHVLAPSQSPADARTMIGEAQDEAYYRRVLTHELSTLFLGVVMERKASGWNFGAAPTWFVQGYQEFLGLNCSTDHARDVTQVRYLEALALNPDRVGLTVVVANDYLDGAVLVRFMHERFGKERVQDLLRSTAPTFDAALEHELGVTPELLVNEFRAWLSR
jgi:hypothetical protein